MPWFSSDECPICLIFILYKYVNFLTILRPAFYANSCLAYPPRWNSNINDRHAKLDNACWRFWKIYNFQIFGQSDRQDRSEKGSWRFGWVPSKTQMFGTFPKEMFITQLSRNICPISYDCCLFSDANISLDLYLRFLSKNEYLGLNCMWWKST